MGMTEGCAGMTGTEVGMTGRGWIPAYAGMTETCGGLQEMRVTTGDSRVGMDLRRIASFGGFSAGFEGLSSSMEGISRLSHFTVLRGCRAGGGDYWGLTGFWRLRGTRARTSFCTDSVGFCRLRVGGMVDRRLGIGDCNMCGASPWAVVSYFRVLAMCLW